METPTDIKPSMAGLVNDDPLNPINSLNNFDLRNCPSGPINSMRNNVITNSNSQRNNCNSFTILPLLSSEECQYIIAAATPLMGSMNRLYTQEVRSSERAMLNSPTVANQLYLRILPHLLKSDYVNRTPMCFGQDGVWVPFGLNDCLKVFRYREGGLFTTHRDGPWIPHHDRCSMYTVVIYLNEGFRGGQTILQYDSVAPKEGMALLFNHDQYHSGSEVKGAVPKWILRTELIFLRVHSFYVDKDFFSNDTEYQAALKLYEESQQAVLEGDRDGFFHKYQEVVARQREAMLRVEHARKPRLLPSIGLEELSIILSFLTDQTINLLLRLNRGTYMAVAQAPYWQDRFEERTDPPLPLEPLGDVGIDASVALRKVGGEINPHNDYFTLIRQRMRMVKHFMPRGLLLLNSGFALLVSKSDTLYATHSDSEVQLTEKTLGPVDRLICYHSFQRTPGTFHMRQVDKFVSSFDARSLNPKVELLEELISSSLGSRDYPIVIVPPSLWWNPRKRCSSHTSAAKKDNPQPNERIDALAMQILDEYRVPAMAVCHPATLLEFGSFIRRFWKGTRLSKLFSSVTQPVTLVHSKLTLINLFPFV